MRPVNLLPASERRHLVNAKRLQNSSFVVLGVLGALLLASLYYVSTGNKINGAKTDIAKANQRTEEAKARAAALGPFARFAQLKETRVNSVKTAATQRFDWERLMREVALVLPDGTSIQTMDASTSPDASAGSSGGGASASTSTPAPAGGASTDSSPSMNLVGCAKSQPTVATLMVRLRALYRVDDVTLKDSQKSDSGGAGGSPAGGTPDAAGGGQGDCTGGLYKFDVSVAFKPAADNSGTGSDVKKAPSRLGGGA